MFKVLLVDDEPLVLIGLQGMLDWNKLGWEIVGTARNGKEALELVKEQCPDLVLCDIKMPVMGGLALAKKCQELDLGLPVFIMLTSYEEFDYVKQSINLGVLEYLVKLDLTPQSLENALRRAEHRIQRERALRAPGSAVLTPANGLSQYRERFFLQLYGGLFDDGEEFRRLCGDFGLRFDAPYYVVALGALQNRTLDTKQLATLSAGITNMAASTLPKYMSCTVTGMDLRHFSALFPLSELGMWEEQVSAALEKAGEVASVFNFSPNYLSQLFSQWGESGFVEFVTATRVNAAKDLMASTDLKIYEISERVGFDSAFYFSKVFKKVEGISPREYMQRVKGG